MDRSRRDALRVPGPRRHRPLSDGHAATTPASVGRAPTPLEPFVRLRERALGPLDLELAFGCRGRGFRVLAFDDLQAPAHALELVREPVGGVRAWSPGGRRVTIAAEPRHLGAELGLASSPGACRPASASPSARHAPAGLGCSTASPPPSRAVSPNTRRTRHRRPAAVPSCPAECLARIGSTEHTSRAAPIASAWAEEARPASGQRLELREPRGRDRFPGRPGRAEALGRPSLRRQGGLLRRPDLGPGVDQGSDAVRISVAELVQRPRDHGRLAERLHGRGVLAVGRPRAAVGERIAGRDERLGRLPEERGGLVGRAATGVMGHP